VDAREPERRLMLPTPNTPKTCICCGREFLPQYSSMQVACGLRCAKTVAKREREAKEVKEREELKARKDAAKKVGDIEEECRRIVQKIARLRDKDEGCISCDKPAGWDGQWHGSHYRAHGGCSSLQFHLWNINKACWICNKIYSGRRDQYQVGIVQRYGPERLEWLDNQPKSRKYSREYLARFKVVMGKRLRRMEKRLEMA
jgi:hypothetical protein